MSCISFQGNPEEAKEADEANEAKEANEAVKLCWIQLQTC
jgi:hypothetical protein